MFYSFFTAQFIRYLLSDIGYDHPVWQGFARCFKHLMDALNTSFAIGKGPVLFEGGGCRKQNVCEVGGFTGKYILDQYEIELAECLLNVIGVWIGHHWVFPHDVHSPDLHFEGCVRGFATALTLG